VTEINRNPTYRYNPAYHFQGRPFPISVSCLYIQADRRSHGGDIAVSSYLSASAESL